VIPCLATTEKLDLTLQRVHVPTGLVESGNSAFGVACGVASATVGFEFFLEKNAIRSRGRETSDERVLRQGIKWDDVNERAQLPRYSIG
jgi:hypothetical protein